MSNFFAHQNYSSPALSPLDNNARLALHLSLYLSKTQQEVEGCWSGQHLGATLRHTCHAIEALHQLHWRAYEQSVEGGLGWLLNLPDLAKQHEEEEQEAVYLHPSRFKTLAWLKCFDNPTVLDDFAKLSNRINEDGLLYNLIGKPILGAIIYADCLTYLPPAQILPAWQQNQNAILTMVRKELINWCGRSERETASSLISSLSDASYALDLLLRIEQTSLDQLIIDHVRQRMCTHIETAQSANTLSSDLLYCAIQLANHFDKHEQVEDALAHFFTNLRMYYDREDILVDARVATLHPLVLRALLAYGGNAIREQMLDRLLEREFEAIDQAKSATESRKIIFEKLIRQKTSITIVNVEELSGGISEARIFRVGYELGTESLVETTESNRTKLTPPSIVVRRDTPAAIHAAVKQYQQLRPDIQHLFAKHAGEPAVFEATMEAPAFLILEDLTHDYRTFRQLFDGIDRPHLSNDNRNMLKRSCTTLVRELCCI